MPCYVQLSSDSEKKEDMDEKERKLHEASGIKYF